MRDVSNAGLDLLPGTCRDGECEHEACGALEEALEKERRGSPAKLTLQTLFSTFWAAHCDAEIAMQEAMQVP